MHAGERLKLTLHKPFRRWSVLNKNMDVVSCSLQEDMDPFEEINVDNKLQNLIVKPFSK